MPLTRTEKNMLGFGALAALAVAVFAAGDALADDEDEELEPELGEETDEPQPATFVPEDPVGPQRPEPVKIFEPDIFLASKRQCERSGESFNVMQWATTLPDGPAQVALAMTALGFPITPDEIIAADKVRGRNFRIWDAPNVVGKRSQTVRLFQAVARSRALPGHVGADAGSVDGIPGECTLESLTAAVERFNDGNWPAP